MGIELLVLLSILIFIILIGTPISFGLGFVAVAGTLIFISPDQLIQIPSVVFEMGTSMNQMVAPMFILMAEILSQGNVASDIFKVLSKWLNRFNGGLATSATVASTIFAALCGSSPATAAAIGRISIDEMTKRNYKQDFAAGVVAAGGTLGIMIPPSMSMVIYAIITENSVAKLFVAGLVPGIMMSAILVIYILLVGRLSPKTVGSTSIQPRVDVKINEPQTNFLQDMKSIFPPVILIIIVLGLIYTGTATPTESAGIGAIGALLIVVLLGRFNIKLLKNILTRTARTSAMIIFLIFGGMSLSYLVSYLGIAQNLADFIITLGVNKWLILAGVYVLWFILGCLMDPTSMIILTVPFMYPTLTGLGFDPIWLGVVSTLAVEIGMITPPVGLNLFVIKGISVVPMNKIIRGVIPFVGILVICLIVLTIFPEIATYLPSHM